jgi:hypothetical protein
MRVPKRVSCSGGPDARYLAVSGVRELRGVDAVIGPSVGWLGFGGATTSVARRRQTLVFELERKVLVSQPI